jgi:hypothetical protein
MEAIGKLGEEATKAGVLVDTAGLAPSATGARVEVGKTSPSRTVPVIALHYESRP